MWRAETEGASFVEVVEGEEREWGAVDERLVQVESL